MHAWFGKGTDQPGIPHNAGIGLGISGDRKTNGKKFFYKKSVLSLGAPGASPSGDNHFGRLAKNQRNRHSLANSNQGIVMGVKEDAWVPPPPWE
jgi:hypothetical protein